MDLISTHRHADLHVRSLAFYDQSGDVPDLVMLREGPDALRCPVRDIEGIAPQQGPRHVDTAGPHKSDTFHAIKLSITLTGEQPYSLAGIYQRASPKRIQSDTIVERSPRPVQWDLRRSDLRRHPFFCRRGNGRHLRDRKTWTQYERRRRERNCRGNNHQSLHDAPDVSSYPTWKLLTKVDGVRTTHCWPWDFVPANFTVNDALPFFTGALTC